MWFTYRGRKWNLLSLPQVVPSMPPPVERELFYEFQRVEARRLLHRLQNELEFMLFLKEAAQTKVIDCGELDFLDPTVCTQCNKKQLHGHCPVHGLPCFIQDKQTSGTHARNAGQLKAPDNYAAWTTPDCLEVAPSGISGAGYGVWTRHIFLKGTMFGPYRGKKVYAETVAHRSSYTWEIYNEGKLDHYIDAQEPSHSNWMRYVNCSSSESTQNVKALQFCGQIYYCACIDIQTNTEMVTWYGDEYAEEMQILERSSKSKVGRVFVNKADHNDLKKKSVKVDEFPSPEVRRDLGFEVRQLESREFNDVISADCSEEGKSGSMAEDKEKPHRCSQCNKAFKDKSKLRRHMRIHTGEKPFDCFVCGMKFSQSGDLNRHMRIHTGNKPYDCSVCGMMFNQLGDLNRHMRIHTGEKPLECSVCGMKFNQPSGLNYHMCVHTGEKPYGCYLCGMKFIRAYSHNQHMRIHTGEKPYDCSVCGMKFSQSGGLIRHTRIHTGEKPYECSVCGMKFVQLGNRNVHMRIHTGEKPLNSSRLP